MKPNHQDSPRNRNGRPLALSLVLVWLFSTFAQAANWCCVPEASSGTREDGEVSLTAHGDAHSRSHPASYAAVAGTVDVHDGGSGEDKDRGCREVKQPDASLQSNWAVYVPPTGLDQPGPVGIALALILLRAPALASTIRPSSVPPPSLNPFLSTIRLLL
jgi:hypothetical protein